MNSSPGATYDRYFLSAEAESVMRAGNILPSAMSVEHLLDQVTSAVSRVTARYSSTVAAHALGERISGLIESGICTLGSPALTNIASGDRPAASCAAVPLPADRNSVADNLGQSERYYLQNMGSGYNLDQFPDPVAELLRLNDHAHTVQDSGRCERYVGNMAHIGAEHPRAEEFIHAKVEHKVPHFNISLDFSERHISDLSDESSCASRVLAMSATHAWECGDPGVLSLDRFNKENPLVMQSRYMTTAPCAEVGLAPGDTCVFGYINIAAFLRSHRMTDYAWNDLAAVVDSLIECLDGLVDLGIDTLPDALSRRHAKMKRRIGISICGYADLLLWTGTAYGSTVGTRILEEVLGFIQLHSRRASARLARTRGAFPLYWQSRWIDAEFRAKDAAYDRELSCDWEDLNREIEQSGLRNAVVTAAPPSGRASLLIGAYQSIEPPLADPRTCALNPSLREFLCRNRVDTPVLRTATGIPWREHLEVLAATNRHVDEGVSKTINLDQSAEVEDVHAIYKTALTAGLRAISIYRPPEGRRSVPA